MIQNIEEFEKVFGKMAETVIAQTKRIAEVEKELNQREKTEDNREKAKEETAPIKQMPNILTRGFNSLKSAFDDLGQKMLPLQSILSDIREGTLDNLGLNAEWRNDEKRREQFNEVNKKKDEKDTTTPVPTRGQSDDIDMGNPGLSSFFGGLFGALGGISWGSAIAGFAVAPFVYRFLDGFLNEVTDGIVDLTPSAITGLSALIQTRFTSMLRFLSPVTRAFDSIIRAARLIGTRVFGFMKGWTRVSGAITRIGATLGGFGRMLGGLGGFIARTFNALPGAGILRTLLGRLAWPITILIGAVDAVREFMNTEGTIVERFTAGVGALLGSIIGAPLDLLRQGVAWVLERFGFDQASEFLQSFSIRDEIQRIVQAMGSIITDSIGWMLDRLSVPVNAIRDLWVEVFGEGVSLLDVLWAPIGAFGNFVIGMFTDPIGTLREGIRAYFGAYATIGEWIWNRMTGIFSWITDRFPNATSFFAARWASLMGGFETLNEWIWGRVSSVFDWIRERIPSWDTIRESLEPFSIRDLLSDALENMRLWFIELFDFLPSVEEIRQRLVSILPDWMQPATIEEQLQGLREELAEMEENARNALPAADQWDNPLRNDTREDYEAAAAAIRAQLRDLEGLSRGGIVNAPRSGGLAMLHGAEIVAPLESPQGRALTAINELIGTASGRSMREDYIARSAERSAIQQARAQAAITNVMPQMINSRPITNNSSSTTIINNVSPARTLDDPSILR